MTPWKIVGTVATFLYVCSKRRTEHDGNANVWRGGLGSSALISVSATQNDLNHKVADYFLSCFLPCCN